MISARQRRSCGKVMLSQVFVILLRGLSGYPRGEGYVQRQCGYVQRQGGYVGGGYHRGGGYSPPLIMTPSGSHQKHIVGKQAVRILLECFLVFFKNTLLMIIFTTKKSAYYLTLKSPTTLENYSTIEIVWTIRRANYCAALSEYIHTCHESNYCDYNARNGSTIVLLIATVSA